MKKPSKLRLARLEAGIGFEQACKVTGLSTSFLASVERGERTLDAECAKKLADLYQKNLDEIFFVSRYAIRVS
ncbi:helix-turn-helix transcriptional regulator [Neobacillus sp. WH10]|uniref:helix-turn-helix transcriptional regulator n=1 Tax=Neobacillus sp. WH10 TaxID=3047873 RepID=UPI0024C10B40|nr:helix-turn-helix transcriptional regulator [Neobacillus sp. WH10]WHY76265.1 helix-turn-helix transcriptional regulator [Neobacillus sp. WH10]